MAHGPRMNMKMGMLAGTERQGQGLLASGPPFDGLRTGPSTAWEDALPARAPTSLRTNGEVRVVVAFCSPRERVICMGMMDGTTRVDSAGVDEWGQVRVVLRVPVRIRRCRAMITSRARVPASQPARTSLV